MRSPRALALLALLFCLGGCQRAAEFSVGARGIDAAELRARQERGQPMTILDVRPEAPSAGRISGALALTVDEAAGFLDRAGLARERLVVAVSERGLRSLELATMGRAQGYPQTRNLSGGMARWRALDLPLEQGPPPAVEPRLLELPVRLISRFEQLVNVLSGFVVKPLYMTLSFIIILRLRRRPDRDLVLIKWGMIALLAGELACAVNFAPEIGNSGYIDIFHSLGLVLMGTYLSWGLFELFDRRILRLADPEARCVVQRFCGRCWKREPVTCGIQRLFRLLAPALAVVALIPLSSPLAPLRFATPVFRSDMMTEYYWMVQLAELRVYPLAACILFLITAALLCGGPRSMHAAKVPFFWALGFMTYSLVRYLLVGTFRLEPTWSNWWEELTELIAVAAVGYLLVVFREQLGLGRQGAAPEPRPPA